MRRQRCSVAALLLAVLLLLCAPLQARCQLPPELRTRFSTELPVYAAIASTEYFDALRGFMHVQERIGRTYQLLIACLDDCAATPPCDSAPTGTTTLARVLCYRGDGGTQRFSSWSLVLMLAASLSQMASNQHVVFRLETVEAYDAGFVLVSGTSKRGGRLRRGQVRPGGQAEL